MTQYFVPVLSSEAGSCLTAANWQEVGVKAVSYYLDTLLIKPGYEFLNTLSDLGHYVNWSGPLILNASNMIANREGIFTLTSSFDGSKIKISSVDLVGLIQKLKPSVALLPPNILKDIPDLWENWDCSIQVYIASNDGHAAYGSMKDLPSYLPKYIMEPCTLEDLTMLSQQAVDFIESDEPARLALAGLVYREGKLLDLKDSAVRLQFETIDSDCICPTCAQGLSQAYLHHLYHHTPLLCQRFLIQHNIYIAQARIVK